LNADSVIWVIWRKNRKLLLWVAHKHSNNRQIFYDIGLHVWSQIFIIKQLKSPKTVNIRCIKAILIDISVPHSHLRSDLVLFSIHGGVGLKNCPPQLCSIWVVECDPCWQWFKLTIHIQVARVITYILTIHIGQEWSLNLVVFWNFAQGVCHIVDLWQGPVIDDATVNVKLEIGVIVRECWKLLNQVDDCRSIFSSILSFWVCPDFDKDCLIIPILCDIGHFKGFVILQVQELVRKKGIIISSLVDSWVVSNIRVLNGVKTRKIELEWLKLNVQDDAVVVDNVALTVYNQVARRVSVVLNAINFLVPAMIPYKQISWRAHFNAWELTVKHRVQLQRWNTLFQAVGAVGLGDVVGLDHELSRRRVEGDDVCLNSLPRVWGSFIDERILPVAALCEHLGFVYARQLVESWVFPVPFHAKFRERDILWWVPDRVLDVTNGPLHKLNGGTERF